MYFDRFDICEAYYMYDVLYNPTKYAAKLRRLDFRPSPTIRLEDLSENAKEIFGALVRRHNRLYTGYTRYQKRNPAAPSWPGTNNMRNGERAWLESIGALAAVESMV